MSLQKLESSELSRRTQQFESSTREYFVGKPTPVQIEVDSNREFIDFANSRLFFEAVLVGGDATTKPVAWVASQYIKNLRVRTMGGNNIGNEIHEYRAVYQHQKKLTVDNEKTSSYLNILEGAKPDAAVTDYGDTSIEYGHKLDNHIFAMKGYYPAHFHQGFILEFDLPSNISELYVASSGILPTSVKLTNIRFVCDLVKLQPEAEIALSRLVAEDRLFVDYMETQLQTNTLQVSAGQQSYEMIGIHGRVKAAFVFTILNDTFDGVPEEYFGTMGRNNLGSYRFKLGSQYINYRAISTKSSLVAESKFELLKALDVATVDRIPGNSVVLTPLLLDTKVFSIGVKTTKAQMLVDRKISSMLDKSRNNLRVELVYDSAPASAGLIYTYVVLDKRLKISEGSQVQTVNV